MDLPEPSIQNLLDAKTLRWIFVGGKGGVGKTTCSCCIATELAKVRERVLILSTDPAHNLSDAFDQKFSRTPTKVKGFDNLYAMEIDPNLNLTELEEDLVGSEEAALSADIRRSITHLMTSFPGIDEYMSYTEVFRLVRNLDYSVVIFDTAPTGHTLRLLAFPEAMEKSLTKVVAMKNQEYTRFCCECLAVEAASWKTSCASCSVKFQTLTSGTVRFRLLIGPYILGCFVAQVSSDVEELTAQDIDVHNIIVNQLLFPNLLSPAADHHSESAGDPNTCHNPKLPTSCRMCTARHKIQSKYLEQILELYEDMHVVQLPQLEEEVRGVESVKAFARNLLVPFRR
ncbi:arsenite-transporting ATPase [Clonorchis sinensis]|uniref:Arsenite-transporting ATPase n=1 Tax=Clonorchis sinensis TaxID=79923 RepID=G7YFJ0_CLOSI|nr:arsenite-transporting ATPase [Clonorchis sinensis]